MYHVQGPACRTTVPPPSTRIPPPQSCRPASSRRSLTPAGAAAIKPATASTTQSFRALPACSSRRRCAHHWPDRQTAAGSALMKLRFPVI